MALLLPVIFLLNLVIHLINSIGAQAITDFAWSIYTRFPTKLSAQYKKQTELRTDLIKLQTTLRTLSAQDQFALWAKTKREVDKAEVKYNTSKTELEAAKSSFSTRAKGVRWTLTNGLRLGLQFWFSRQPMFWTPQKWLPYHVEWILAFPKAQLGSVSIQIWGFACAKVISLASDAIVSVVTKYKERQNPVPSKENMDKAKVEGEEPSWKKLVPPEVD